MATARDDRRHTLRVEGEGSFVVAPSVDARLIAQALRAHRENVDLARRLKWTFDRRVTRVSLETEGDAEAPLEIVVKERLLPWRWRIAHMLGVPSRFAGDGERGRSLSDRGIRVPRFLAASLRVRRGSAFLLTEDVSGGSPLSRLFWQGPGALEWPEPLSGLLAAVGRWLRTVHDLGIWQRDMKPDNLLVVGDDKEAWEFVLVDFSEVRFFGRGLDVARRTRNMGQLLDLPAALDPAARAPFLDAYLGPTASGERAGWEGRLAQDILARRAERRRRGGGTYVDEERST